MAVWSETNVKRVLKPYHGLIREVVDTAWEEWRVLQALRIDAGMVPVLYSRTRSNYVFDAIARIAIPRFGAEPRIMVSVEAQTFKLCISGSVIVRFKKGGEDGMGCNIPTQAAMAFMASDGVLPGLPAEGAKVEVIWRANDIGTQLDSVSVVARDGEHLLWQYQIEGNEEKGQVISFPHAPMDPSDNGNDNLIKPKTSPLQKLEKQ